MVWIDSVRSLANHTANVTASSTANRIVVVCKGTPMSSASLSLMRVPTMLINTTASPGAQAGPAPSPVEVFEDDDVGCRRREGEQRLATVARQHHLVTG